MCDQRLIWRQTAALGTCLVMANKIKTGQTVTLGLKVSEPTQINPGSQVHFCYFMADAMFGIWLTFSPALNARLPFYFRIVSVSNKKFNANVIRISLPGLISMVMDLDSSESTWTTAFCPYPLLQSKVLQLQELKGAVCHVKSASKHVMKIYI